LLVGELDRLAEAAEQTFPHLALHHAHRARRDRVGELARIIAHGGHQLGLRYRAVDDADPLRSCAVTRRADSSMSVACAGPMSRGSSQARPYSAISPRRAKAVVKIASLPAKRRSQ